MTIRKRRKIPPPEPIAGNGLLDRRALLGRGIIFAGAMGTGAGASLTGAVAEPLQNDPWSLEMGSVVPAYQVPSRFEKDVIRTRSNPNNEFRNSHARTPHHLLQGTITPNGLFFTISHSLIGAACFNASSVRPLNVSWVEISVRFAAFPTIGTCGGF